MVIDFGDVQAAASMIEGRVKCTPVENSTVIDKMVGCRVHIKCENLQHVGAFKFRGACNAISRISEDAASRGVCTHSSGNHAQAIALAARERGIPAYIVMPSNAPSIKRKSVEDYGAEITFCEPTLVARETTAASVVENTGATFIHAYENSFVIAGQGTSALELLTEVGELDALMAPIGGGGLMSGTCIAGRGIQPDIRLFGAEPNGADDAARSLLAGKRLLQTSPNTICDGLLTSLGENTWPILRDHLEGIITVTDNEVREAMKILWDEFSMIVEPSGATSLAAILSSSFQEISGIESIGIILSGGNVDLENLPFTIDDIC